MQALLRARECNIEHIDIVHLLHFLLLMQRRCEQSVFYRTAHEDRIGPGGFRNERRAFGIEPAPLPSGLVETHFVRIGEDEIWRLQALRLVDGNHPDGVGAGRGTDGEFSIVPVPQILPQFIAIGIAPLPQVVHKGLDIKCFAIEILRRSCS